MRRANCVTREIAKMRWGVAGVTLTVVVIVVWLSELLSMENSGKGGSPFMSAGFQCRAHVDEAGIEHRYVVAVPQHYQSERRMPVLLFLNGRGQNGDDGVRQLLSGQFGPSVWGMREFSSFIIVAPQCRHGEEWVARGWDVRGALRIVDEVVKEFHADEDRVYLTGVSAGGSGAWDVASAFPGRFAAAVPLCGISVGDVDRLGMANVPVWAIYNDGDGAAIVDSNRAVRARLIELGLSPLVSEYNQGGHNCWTRAYNNPALYGWLLAQSRTSNRTERRYEYLPARRLVEEWEQGTMGVWSVGEEGALVGKRQHPADEGWLESRVAAEAFEMHADFWLAGNAREVVLRNGSGPGEAFRLTICLPSDGTGGISDSYGRWLARLDPVGQRALQKNSWNEVRLRVDIGSLKVRLNGCPAMDVELPGGSRDYRCAFAATVDAEIRWRLVRWRVDEEKTNKDKDHESHK